MEFKLFLSSFCAFLSCGFVLSSTNILEKTERNLVLVKPDGVQRGLVGEVMKRFEAKGFKLVAMKFMKVKN